MVLSLKYYYKEFDISAALNRYYKSKKLHYFLHEQLEMCALCIQFIQLFTLEKKYLGNLLLRGAVQVA
jgi:hypothetical protein